MNQDNKDVQFQVSGDFYSLFLILVLPLLLNLNSTYLLLFLLILNYYNSTNSLEISSFRLATFLVTPLRQYHLRTKHIKKPHAGCLINLSISTITKAKSKG